MKEAFLSRSRVLVGLALVMTSSVPAVVINMGPSATVVGWHSVGEQGAVGGVIDNNPSWDGGYYGSTAALADGYYYLTWGQTKTVRTIRWIGSAADSSRKLADFTVLQLTGANPASPGDWTPIPGCTVTGNTALEVDFNLPSAILTKGVKVNYTNQVRPLTGEFEVFDQPMTTPAQTTTAINQLYGAPGDATDRYALTTWGSGGLNNGPGWLVMDFGQDRTLAGFRLRWRVQGGYYLAPQDWQLQAWDSGLNDWVTFRSLTNWSSTLPLYETDLASPLTTSKIRVYASLPQVSANIAGGSMGIADFEAIQFIPEPASLALLALGGLALFRRPRR